jgi:hypothetical protein
VKRLQKGCSLKTYALSRHVVSFGPFSRVTAVEDDSGYGGICCIKLAIKKQCASLAIALFDDAQLSSMYAFLQQVPLKHYRLRYIKLP